MLAEKLCPEAIRGSSSTIALLITRGLMVAAPALTLLVLSAISGNNCFGGRPVWSDEIDYWREIYSFAYASDHQFGYYGFLGHPAKIGEWGCHGIAPLLVYGIPSLLFGWSSNSIVVCNIALCCVCFLVFSVMVRPTVGQCLLIIASWLLYTPILIYAPTSMIELSMYSGGIIAVALLAMHAKHRKWATIAYFAFVFIFAGIRLSNIVFFIPIIVFAIKSGNVKQRWGGVVLYIAVLLALSIGAYLFFSLFQAGYPYGFMAKLSLAQGLEDKFELLFAHAATNLGQFFSLKGEITQVAQRYAYLAATLLSLVMFLLTALRKCKTCDGVGFGEYEKACMACFLVLLAAAGLVIAAYDVFDWRDYRTLSPILWTMLLLLVVFAPKGLLQRITFTLVGCLLAFVLLTGFDGIATVNAMNEEARFSEEGTEQESLDLSMVVPVEDTPEGRTIVIVGSPPSWVIFSLDPSMGTLYDLGAAGSDDYPYVLYAGVDASQKPGSLVFGKDNVAIYIVEGYMAGMSD